ncbi:hypothetical protein ABC468_00565 [Mycoplasmopsis synoviae]|uniref:hypothetical protein n=1 Tax=Mycoplasmopsis synoviae TaxID=2109 RepID=UPI00356802D1
MDLILETLQKRLNSDKKKLKFYEFLDRFIGLFITFINIVILIIASLALDKLTSDSEFNKNNLFSQNTSLLLLIAFTIVLIVSFFLNIVIEIYKINQRYDEYKKVSNTFSYLIVKYRTKFINEKDLIAQTNKLWEKASKKTKIQIKRYLINMVKGTN